jgi:hypothetical protein
MENSVGFIFNPMPLTTENNIFWLHSFQN